jgi:hypothetical protein
MKNERKKIIAYKAAFPKEYEELFAIPSVDLKAFEGLLITDKDKKKQEHELLWVMCLNIINKNV